MNNFDNVMRISEQAEKENEINRLKRRFNFYGASDSSSKSQNLSSNSVNTSVNVNNINKNNPKSKESKPKQNRQQSNFKKVTFKDKNTYSSNRPNYQSSQKAPISINNVVNIVNNNYNNIITPGSIKENYPMNRKHTKSQSQILYTNDDETERKSVNQRAKLGNPALEEALNTTSQRSVNSVNYRDITDYMNLKHNPSNSELIPSEEDIFYNKNDYNEKIKKVTGFKNYVRRPSVENKIIYGDDEEVNANERDSRSYKNHNQQYLDYFKKNSIFINNPAYNLSNRLINDERRHPHTFEQNPNYKFIQKIREEKDLFQVLKLKMFVRLSDDSVFNILSFIFNQYDDLMNANKIFAKKIGLSLSNKFGGVIDSFRQKYQDVLELQEYYFKHTPFRKENSQISVVDLVLKSKIFCKEVNRCVEISFIFFIKGKEYIQTWKLDLKKKGDIGFWFASEAEEYNKSIIRYCYYQPIISFCKDDFVEMRINIFSKMGIINPDNVEWVDLVVYKSPEHTFLDYEKSLVKSNVMFDKVRFCELENIIHVWKDEKSLTKKQNIEEFKKYFQKYFKIFSINYDFSKFYIFKVKMQAKSVGCVKRNKFTNVDIEIKPYSEGVTNETQCLGLLNINHLNKKVEIRVSSYVIFYFTDLYL